MSEKGSSSRRRKCLVCVDELELLYAVFSMKPSTLEIYFPILNPGRFSLAECGEFVLNSVASQQIPSDQNFGHSTEKTASSSVSCLLIC